MFEIIHNVETGEVVERVFTEEELKTIQLAAQEANNKQMLVDAEIAAKEMARAEILAKLGLTPEEAKLLLS